MSLPSHAAAALASGSRMVLYGGVGLDGAALGDAHVLDAAAGWSALATTPPLPPKFGHSLTGLPSGAPLAVGGAGSPGQAGGRAASGRALQGALSERLRPPAPPHNQIFFF